MADEEQMVDERRVRFQERFVPAWIVMESVGRAIGEDVKGVERRGEKFAVLVAPEGNE